MERQALDWEKIFANPISDKGLASQIYKELSQLSNEKTNSPIKKTGRGPKWTFWLKAIGGMGRHALAAMLWMVRLASKMEECETLWLSFTGTESTS